MTRVNLLKKRDNRGRLAFLSACFLIALLMSNFSDAFSGGSIDQGLNTVAGEFPAVVGFRTSDRTKKESPQSTCTGFFITPKLILTAAHCLKGFSSVPFVTNAVKIGDRREEGSQNFHIQKSNYHPSYVQLSENISARSSASVLATASDVGYLLLKEDAVGITPYPVYPTNGKTSDMSIMSSPVTLVGYGADNFSDVLKDAETALRDDRNAGAVYRSHFGEKKKGNRTVNTVYPESILLQEGEKFGGLPGDSGGPILIDRGGMMTVIALNHSYVPRKYSMARAETYDRKGNPKPLKYDEVTEYDSTVGTVLNTENLCWVVKDSGEQIPGISCTNPK